MKRIDALLVLTVVCLAVLFFVVTDLYFSNKVYIVIKEETTPNLINIDASTICPNLCKQRGYDGWRGSGGTEVPLTTTCDCYWFARRVSKPVH